MAVADGSPRLRNSPGSPPVIVVSKDIGLSVQPQSGGRRWSGTDRRGYPEIKWHRAEQRIGGAGRQIECTGPSVERHTPASPVSRPALVAYRGLKDHRVPLVFDLGYMDVPFSQAEATSSNDIPLVERAAIINLATTIMADDFRSAFGVRSFSDRYWAGAYVTGPTSGANHTTGEPLGAVGRAGYNIFYSPEGWFHLEADVGALLKPPAPGGIRSITLSDRPELRVDPTQILSTGPIGTAANPLTNAEVYGGGGIAEWRNFLVDGEAYLININRQGLATNSFEGGYIEGSRILTGGSANIRHRRVRILRPVPEHPFLPFDGSCCGAFELAARYSTIDLNSNFTPRPPLGSNPVGGGQQTVYAVGFNWYPNANMRFMFDYLHGKINKRFSASAGGGIPGAPPGPGGR